MYLFDYAPRCCSLKRQVRLQLQPGQTSGCASSSLPEPLSSNTTHPQSPLNTAQRSQVKPLCLHLTSKTNTAQFRSMQTLEYERVKGEVDGGGGRREAHRNSQKMEQSKTPNKTRAAPEQYECLLVESFISFVFISLLLSLSPCYLCSR